MEIETVGHKMSSRLGPSGIKHSLNSAQDCVRIRGIQARQKRGATYVAICYNPRHPKLLCIPVLGNLAIARGRYAAALRYQAIRA